MQYAIFTSKHHDGYAMYHTRENDFSVEHSPYGKDIVRSFLDAMRAEGLRVGLYFSLIDWHHPDYPAFTDADRPYRWGQWRRSSPEAWARYQQFMFGQIRELLTDYGKIDIIWFDGGWERTPDEWKATELEAMIRSLQPEILINDRLPGAGDYDTPEQFVPPQLPGRAWEACMTINESWGYNPDDKQFKSGRQLVHTLCEIAARGGNLLLNVGPMADGKLPPELLERLAVIEGWMARNAESIIGTDAGAGAVAVLRPVHAPRRPHLPAPADAALRHGVGARAAHPPRALGACAGRRPRAGVHDTRADYREPVRRRPGRRDHDHGAGGCRRSVCDRAGARRGLSRESDFGALFGTATNDTNCTNRRIPASDFVKSVYSWPFGRTSAVQRRA